MKVITRPYLLFLLAVLASCGGGGASSPSTPAQIPTLEGYVQKGPFIQGSTVTVQELNSSFNPTGSTYSTETTNDTGLFSLTSSISANYVGISTQGFYYNEVAGALSSAAITLRVISYITGEGNITNINLLTTLEKDRIEYLVQSAKKTFANALSQAQTEVLDIFHIDPEREGGLSNFDQMNISQTGNSNAVLLYT